MAFLAASHKKGLARRGAQARDSKLLILAHWAGAWITPETNELARVLSTMTPRYIVRPACQLLTFLMQKADAYEMKSTLVIIPRSPSTKGVSHTRWIAEELMGAARVYPPVVPH